MEDPELRGKRLSQNRKKKMGFRVQEKKNILLYRAYLIWQANEKVLHEQESKKTWSCCNAGNAFCKRNESFPDGNGARLEGTANEKKRRLDKKRINLRHKTLVSKKNTLKSGALERLRGVEGGKDQGEEGQ